MLPHRHNLPRQPLLPLGHLLLLLRRLVRRHSLATSPLPRQSTPLRQEPRRRLLSPGDRVRGRRVSEGVPRGARVRVQRAERHAEPATRNLNADAVRCGACDGDGDRGGRGEGWGYGYDGQDWRDGCEWVSGAEGG